MEIRDYHPELAHHFDAINREWIENYFSLEPIDEEMLTHPYEVIVQPGGAILFAVSDDEVLGTVSLFKHSDETAELIKMGVYTSARNRGAGRFLMNAALQKAKEMGFNKIILYSNRKLENAIRIYREAGFQELQEHETHYSRCDIQMEMDI